MKLSKIVKRVDQLTEVASAFPVDHQRCAAMERELWEDVLHAFAMGKGTEAKAHAALETTQLQFNRSGS